MRMFFMVSMLLISLVFSSVSHGADPFVGQWSWFQYTNNNARSINSLCTGDMQTFKNGTFQIWNACKVNNAGCYLIEGGTGTWKKLKAGLYRAYYGEYFYDVLVKGTVGYFQSMSVNDIWDRGHLESGVMLKGISIDPLKEYYSIRQCAPEPEDPIIPEPEPEPQPEPQPCTDMKNCPSGGGTRPPL
jgi:hypothetical protein